VKNEKKLILTDNTLEQQYLQTPDLSLGLDFSVRVEFPNLSNNFGARSAFCAEAKMKIDFVIIFGLERIIKVAIPQVAGNSPVVSNFVAALRVNTNPLKIDPPRKISGDQLYSLLQFRSEHENSRSKEN
jgi:hypothetical protein